MINETMSLFCWWLYESKKQSDANIEKGVPGVYRGEMNRNEMMLLGSKIIELMYENAAFGSLRRF